MKTKTNLKNYDDTVESIRALALAIDHQQLTIDTIKTAMLYSEAGRKALSKELDCEEFLLKTTVIDTKNNIKDNPEIDWPENLFEDEDEDIDLFSDLSDDDGDEKPSEDVAVKEQEFITIQKLASNIVENQSKVTFYRRSIFLKLKDLEDTVHTTKEILSKQFPVHSSSINDLLDLIYLQYKQNFLNNKLTRTFPIFLFTYEDNYYSKILEILRMQFKCKVEIFSTEPETTSDFYDKLSELPGTIAILQLIDQTEKNDELEPLITYYKSGINNRANNDDNSGFELLFGGFRHDKPEHTYASIRDIAVNNIIIFMVTIPDEIKEYKHVTPEELSNIIINHYQQNYEETNKTVFYFERLLQLVNNNNSVVFGKLSYSVIKQNVKKYIADIGLHVGKLSEGNLTLLVNLLMLYTGGFKGAKLIQALDFFIQKSGIVSMNPEEIVFEINNQLSYLGDVLNNNKIGKKDTYYQTFFENLEKSNKKVSFQISCVQQKNIIKIYDFHEYTSVVSKGNVYLEERPQLRFSDVIGLNEIKKRFKTIEKYYNNPTPFEKLQMMPNNRILLVGKPGCGKTFITKAFAGEMGIPFFYISASEITSQKYAGYGGSLLREVFRAAKSMKPCILFIDELDTIGNRDDMSSDSVGFDAKSIINTLLVELDGINSENDIIVVGATNRPQDIDPALTRPKRFGTILNADDFSTQDRYNMIKLKLKPENCAEDYQKTITAIIKRTDNDFTPAILEQIVYEAKLNAINNDRVKLTLQDIHEAMDNLILGHKIKEISPSFKNIMAYHQSGHALLHKILFTTQTIEKLSITVYQNSMGIMEVKQDDSLIKQYTPDELMKIIVVQMAGAIAESLKYGAWGLNAEDDWEFVSFLGAKIIGNMSFANSLNPIIENHLSEGITERNMKLIEQLINFSYDFAKNILQENWIDIELLAKQLDDKGELIANEIDTLLNDLPPYEENLFDKFNTSIVKQNFNAE